MTALRRVYRQLTYVFFALAYMYISTSLIIFHGPNKALTSYLIDSLAITRHAYLLRPLSMYTIPNSEITKLSVGWIKSPAVPSTTVTRSYHIQTNSIKIYHYNNSLFSAVIMLISNPKMVHVAVTKHVGTIGETVQQMVQDNGAIAGINGGAFSDSGWHGTGGIPLGTVISYGKYQHVDPNSPIIGMTSGGQLICGTYTPQELKANHVVEALTYGPILVQNGSPVSLTDYGRAPRTAIGQTSDGTIIFIVTDGRNPQHPFGASYKDVQDLMLTYHAVTAANLDGGSSATMVYKGKIINTVADILGARLVATSFVVVPSH